MCLGVCLVLSLDIFHSLATPITPFPCGYYVYIASSYRLYHLTQLTPLISQQYLFATHVIKNKSLYHFITLQKTIDKAWAFPLFHFSPNPWSTVYNPQLFQPQPQLFCFGISMQTLTKTLIFSPCFK